MWVGKVKAMIGVWVVIGRAKVTVGEQKVGQCKRFKQIGMVRIRVMGGFRNIGWIRKDGKHDRSGVASLHGR